MAVQSIIYVLFATGEGEYVGAGADFTNHQVKRDLGEGFDSPDGPFDFPVAPEILPAWAQGCISRATGFRAPNCQMIAPFLRVLPHSAGCPTEFTSTCVHWSF
ncbi:uncharacterized protein EI90DRAFT_3044642 [Cantharellus anzutake]|uniref:uncharacterized protein n=1 Tax=Cantharellus anzutake TaxID=1750568 RepID=UPI00190644F6|nr:uncharacterized protein EI90DRAFT_3044642 [Cantharellus anzutake]KAF8337030.1 hypothetical protein EI90DRAFT_3044642 [Cantharellus anzutake]